MSSDNTNLMNTEQMASKKDLKTGSNVSGNDIITGGNVDDDGDDDDDDYVLDVDDNETSANVGEDHQEFQFESEEEVEDTLTGILKTSIEGFGMDATKVILLNACKIAGIGLYRTKDRESTSKIQELNVAEIRQKVNGFTHATLDSNIVLKAMNTRANLLDNIQAVNTRIVGSVAAREIAQVRVFAYLYHVHINIEAARMQPDFILMVIHGYGSQKNSKSGSVARRSSNANTPSSSASETPSSDISLVKHVKSSDEDKDRITAMYLGLDKSKMWKLSSGTFIEEQMMKYAIIQDYEHLCHSLILNVQDSCWNDYFSSEEMKEIKSFQAKKLPLLPSDTKVYMDELRATPKSTLYEKVNEVTYASNSDRKWVQDCCNTCFRLVQSGFFPLRDVTEQGIGKRMWSCVDTCFDFSTVRCVSGEKCNKASADAANLNRSFSGSRQQCGRKMDYLFKTKDADVELGCGECALVGGINTTKEFQDAGFKMPKVMRDMMFKIVADSPGLVHKLHIPGFYIADKVLTLWILDTPAGYVGRYDAFPSVQYPITESKIRIRMATLLTRNMAARIIMEQCQDIIDDDDSEPSIDRYQFVMEPSFVPVGLANKKRKQ